MAWVGEAESAITTNDPSAAVPLMVIGAAAVPDFVIVTGAYWPAAMRTVSPGTVASTAGCRLQNGSACVPGPESLQELPPLSFT